MSTSHRVMAAASRPPTAVWPESLDTPGIIPRHVMRAVSEALPIFEVLQRALRRLGLHGTTGELEKVVALIGFYKAVKPVYNYLKSFFWWAFTSHITISEHDPAAKEVLAWMGAEGTHNSHTRQAVLVTSSAGTGNAGSTEEAYLRLLSGSDITSGRGDRKSACLPTIGTRLFWIGWRPFLFSRNGSQYTSSGGPGMVVNHRGEVLGLTITTVGWSLAPLVKFADLCHEFHRKNQTGMTTIHLASGTVNEYNGGWQSVPKAVRKLDTIDMDEKVKLDIVRDAEHYYSEQSEQFFADCGIPYRRGYLFFGPPGTGKTSFTAALAGHLGCDIYQINLATGDINDAGLQKTFLCLPKKCIVLIEDIDSAGVDREHGPSLQKPKVQPPMATDVDAAALEVPVPRPRRSAKSHDQSRRSVVTLSGLLNAIDGTSSQEGRLLIMTSNDPDALDPALTRPGRIDKKVYFGNLGKAASKSIFMRLMGRFAVAHDTTLSMDVIEKHADKFADRLPANVFTPAEIQNFLQDCRGDPVKALKGIDDWVTNYQDSFGTDVNGTGANGTGVNGSGVNEHGKSPVQHNE